MMSPWIGLGELIVAVALVVSSPDGGQCPPDSVPDGMTIAVYTSDEESWVAV